LPASLSSPPPAPKRPQRPGSKLVRGDREDRVRGHVRRVDHAQIASGPRSTQGNACSLPSRSILYRSAKHVFERLSLDVEQDRTPGCDADRPMLSRRLDRIRSGFSAYGDGAIMAS
jgi:hypothetical protein